MVTVHAVRLNLAGLNAEHKFQVWHTYLATHHTYVIYEVQKIVFLLL